MKIIKDLSVQFGGTPEISNSVGVHFYWVAYELYESPTTRFQTSYVKVLDSSKTLPFYEQ